MTPLGIFGGTFDPIHCGHIQPIIDVCRQTGIREVRYIPSARPAHRPTPGTDELHRLNMVALALADIPCFIPDDRELRRPGKSYMVPTLKQFRSEFHFRSLCLILGADAFALIQRWYWWAEILKLANIIVVNRLGSSFAPMPVNMRQIVSNEGSHAIWKRICGTVCHVETRRVDISSTDLRKKLARGDNVNGLVPEAVSDYVRKHDLYK